MMKRLNMIHSALVKLLLVTILCYLAGCSEMDSELETVSNKRINNDASLLAARVILKEDTLYLMNESSTGDRVAKRDFELVLKGEIAAPDLEGNTLQATMLTNKGGFLFISYNMAGPKKYGGIDFVNKDLELLSNVLYNDADIHAVAYEKDNIYLVGAATSDTAAFVEILRMKGNQIESVDNQRVHLGSYAATSVVVDNKQVYVTTGNDASLGGGLHKLDDQLNKQRFYALNDARWTYASKESLYVLQGSPGTVTSLNPEDLSLESTFSFPGANELEAKNTMDIADGRIFIAGGLAGVFICDETTGELLHQIAFEDPDAVANAVSAENELIFISNGSGVYVAKYDKKKFSEVPELLGQIDFEETLSANHVLYRGGKMYVAAGLGGVKIIDVNK